MSKSFSYASFNTENVTDEKTNITRKQKHMETNVTCKQKDLHIRHKEIFATL